MTAKQKLTAIQLLIGTDGESLTDGEVLDGVINILDEETASCDIADVLKGVFITDCTEIHGLADSEADEAWEKFGEDFVVDEIEELWNAWSENFPNVECLEIK